ncbi:MAG: hypothetical protein R2824_16260 [Saprospiraceae bacterium]|nr:hypothetical protein [Lewinella sp.]
MKYGLSLALLLVIVLIFTGRQLLLRHQTADRMEVTSNESSRLHVTPMLLERLSKQGISDQNVHVYLRAFKAEGELEVWIKTPEAAAWTLFKTYPFCKNSGTLGPKRKEGDLQIPEGIYHIDRFNPKSKFHLSLGLNYPNASDRILGNPEAPGSDIFIHGGCVTVGCIPITDAGIEEVYVLAEWAKESGQNDIPVHLFPFRFTIANWERYGTKFPQSVPFWQQLEAIYHAFEVDRTVPEVIITESGHYQIRHSMS